MSASGFCSECGAAIKSGLTYCAKCGSKSAGAAQVPPGRQRHTSKQDSSKKSGMVALLLCIFAGVFGLHRFYVGKYITGILMLLTLGGFGLWMLVDVAFIASNKFEDANGNILEVTKSPTPMTKNMTILGSIFGGLIMFVVTLIALAFYLTSGLTDTVRSQLKALRNGEIVTAYSYTSKDFQNSTSLEDFKRFVNKYPSLSNNESSSFYKREIYNNEGTVRGTLHSKDGAETPVEYNLIKENGKWKIYNIRLNPVGADAKENRSSDSSSNQTSDKNISLPNNFDNPASKYSIRYPANWSYEQPDHATVVFSGNKGTPQYYSTVNIQVVLTKKTGGKYGSVIELVNSLKKQARDGAVDTKILAEDAITAPATVTREKMNGRFFVVSYTYNGQKIEQLQYVFLRNDGKVFYAYGYTTTEDRFDLDLPVAKAMFASWSIY